jgi:hypothetical protein
VTPEQINQCFKAMDDSVWVIDQKIINGPSPGDTQEETNGEVSRNVGYLEWALSQDYVQNAGRSLTAYTAAVVNGNNYLAIHGGSVSL